MKPCTLCVIMNGYIIRTWGEIDEDNAHNIISRSPICCDNINLLFIGMKNGQEADT